MIAFRLISLLKTRSLALLLWLLSCVTHAQVEHYPANVTPTLSHPYSAYFSDYIEVGSERLVGNIVFNDFNEASWTFKLKLTISGTNVSLQTKPGFTPTTPITVLPGEPYRLSGSEWAEYFNFQNLNIKGDANALINSGRLPEGMYSFCLQVLDYDTGDPLSMEVCSQVWIQLMDPPRTLSPECDKIIDPITSAQFPITWQSFNTVNPNGQNVDYQLTMWELLDVNANPLSAVANGQALQVYQSDIVNNTSITYGPTQPLLEVGKTYIYRVQALEQEGRNYYKNDGFSEYCYFHYGYPTGGKISLLYPDDEAGFSRGMVPQVIWSSPSQMVPGIGINYELTIKELNENQDPEQGIIANPVWFSKKTPLITIPNQQPQEIGRLKIEQRYAWQVKAFSGDVEVASSEVSTFFGPSLVEQFYAGNSTVLVDYISNKDLNALSGGGRALLSDSKDDWVEVSFTDLVVSESNGYYYLEAGEIVTEIEPRTYSLAPHFEDNGAGEFIYDAFKLTKDGLRIRGKFHWDLPFPVEEGSSTQLVSKEAWVSFNGFTPFGNLFMAEEEYDLFDPSGFALRISESSRVYINQEKFRFELKGAVKAPTHVQSTAMERARWAFFDAEQVGVIRAEDTETFLAMDGAGIAIQPLASVIDFSDNESPGQHADNPYWKGIYLEEARVSLPGGFDYDDQLNVDVPVEETIKQNETDGAELWVVHSGVHLDVNLDLSGSEAYFNTFPAEYTSLKLVLSNQNVDAASKLEGKFFIPLISTEKPFTFESQLCNKGFRPGVVADIAGTTFKHNPEGGDLTLDIAIKKAQIVDKERIQMTLDLSWPSLDVSFEGVPNFNVWGNYSIGFFTPEGIVALAEQVKTTFKDYPVTIDALSAGRNEDAYGIAISGKVVMGEDVAGDDGAPAFNLYSLHKNPLLDKDYIPAQVQGAFDLGASQDGLAAIEAEMAALEADMVKELEAEKAALESSAQQALSAAASAMGGQEYEVSDMVDQSDESEEKVDFATVKEELIVYLELLQGMMSNPEQAEKIGLLITEIKKDNGQLNDLAHIMKDLKGFAAKFASDQLTSMAEKILEPVDRLTNKINGEILKKSNQLTGTVETQIENAVNSAVDEAANRVISKLQDKAPNIAEVVGEVVVSVKARVIARVSNSFSAAVNENITFPLTSFVSANLSDRAHRVLENTISTVVMGALNSDKKPADMMNEVVAGLEEEFESMGEDVKGSVDLDKMMSAIRKVGSDAIEGIKPAEIADDISKAAIDAIGGAVANMAADKLGELANNALGDQIGIDVPVDFGAAGAKLLSGGSPKDLLFDPIPVKVRSPALDINGLIHFMKDHPIYGDGFAGDVQALIKKPNTFAINVIYINGRKEGVSYWMVEVGGAAAAASPEQGEDGPSASTAEAGGEMSGEMKEPEGAKIGPLEIMALRGRVYHHMSAEGLGELKPDANTNYGAYLHLIMYGPKNGDKMRLEIEAAMSTYATGDYAFSFDGNAQFVNQNPSVNKVDKDAAIQAELSLKYNSAEKHFFGFASAVIQTKALCASGSLLIDVKPGAWRVAIGSKEEKIRFVMACVGFGPTGWLDMNQNIIELGLGLEFIFRTTINLDVGVAAIGLLIDAGAAAGIQAIIQHKPEFMVMEAGVWLELWAKILLTYKLPIKKGSVTLADIYVAVDAMMRFNPPPTLLYGDAQARIKVLLFNFSLDKEFEMTM
ncbi:hypothetical protein [Marinoscillum furvescens]|uniref:TANFOR domain-containing protein n=1 Tax=Marinoscillum furvescens DSM 4134 TaxID=1122208 RepID=A0A3D9L4U1_MARFU|nr:hypothetical protein [Marinoscillum furvescens]REE00539.1 hypothetical protein C7460_105165 [Marinoscillum furvescens DSM 4134]